MTMHRTSPPICHAARRLSAAPPRGPGALPARIRRAGPARPALARRLRLASRRSRRGRGLRRARRRLPRLRPRRAARADRRAAGREHRPPREPLRRRRHRSSASTMSPGIAEVLRGDPDEVARRCSTPGSRSRPPGTAARGRDAAHARPRRVRARGARGAGTHPRRRRIPDRALAARRATDVGVARSTSTARSAASTRRRTCSCSSWTGSR